jgi:hypothetical protein
MIFCWAKKYYVPKLGVGGTVSRDPVAHFIESCMTGGTGGVGPVSGGRLSPPQLGVCDAVRVRTPYSRPSSALIINTEKKEYSIFIAAEEAMEFIKFCKTQGDVYWAGSGSVSKVESLYPTVPLFLFDHKC